MWDLPGPGLDPVSPALAGGFLTTAPPGKPEAGVLEAESRECQARRLGQEGNQENPGTVYEGVHISFSEHCKNINKQKSQLSRVGRLDRGAFMPWEDSRAQQEKESLLFLPGKDSANEKPGTLFTKPSQLPFPFYKSILLSMLFGDLHRL